MTATITPTAAPAPKSRPATLLWIALAASLFVGRMLGALVRAVARHAPFGWKPLEAYLSGRKRSEEAAKSYANVDEILDALHGRKRSGRGR